MKYRYFMCGMFDGTDGNRYIIRIPSPFVRDSESEAMKDEAFGYRFLTIDSAEPLLVVFAKEHIEAVNNGKMQVRCWVGKHVVGEYTFENFKKNGGYIRQLKPSSRGKYVTDESDFVETDKTFADILPNIKKHKLYYIDDEAYKISKVAKKTTRQNIRGSEVAYSGTVTAVIPKTIVVFIPALDVEVDVQRSPNASVQNGAVPEVGDIATVQVVLEDGDYAATAATFVPQQDIYKGDRMVDNGFFLLVKDDEDAEEYDWDDEPYVEDFWNWDVD